MNTHKPTRSLFVNRRSFCARLSLPGLLWVTEGVSHAALPGPPEPPYGMPLDVSKANALVQFDVRITKPDRYDVMLEVFQSHPNEAVGHLDWFRRLMDGRFTESSFSVSIQSLEADGRLVVSKEVSVLKRRSHGSGLTRKSDSFWRRLSRLIFGPDAAYKARLMSDHFELIMFQQLPPGVYRVRLISHNAMPALLGRLVQISIIQRTYPK